MRLLNSTTYELKEFDDNRMPPFAILSHRWGVEEVTFKEVQKSKAAPKKGYVKLQKCCAQALRDGFKWVGIDACCIDKSSSSEVSEAINSMYRWYRRAEVCYAYLFDVPPLSPNLNKAMFKASQWFTRGWTLQELIAPSHVTFYAVD